MELQTFKELHSLVNAAYSQFERHQSGESWETPARHEVVTTLNGDSTPYGFVSVRDGQLFIVFRGTVVRPWRTIRSPKLGPEWIRNAHFQPVDYQSGNVHAKGMLARLFASVFSGRYHKMDDPPWRQYGKTSFGFRKHYQPLRPQLMSALSDQIASVERIYICGHSLGGALATLAIPDVIGNDAAFTQKLVVVTFASPRCVDREFAERLRQDRVTVYRVTNSEDVVPCLPAPAYTASGSPDKNDVGFEHVGVPMYFTLHTGTLGGNHAMESYEAGVDLATSAAAKLSK